MGTDFPEDDYIQAFDNALASTASVNTSIIPFGIKGNSPNCDDATAAGSTQVTTNIQVPAADLGAVLDLLPMASSTTDLGGVFGVVSLGDTLEFDPTQVAGMPVADLRALIDLLPTVSSTIELPTFNVVSRESP